MYSCLSGFPVGVSPLVGLGGLEPPTSRLSGVRSNRLSYKPISRLRFSPEAPGGDKRDRTVDLLLAKQALSQLSYTPILVAVSHPPLSVSFKTLKIKQRLTDGSDQPWMLEQLVSSAQFSIERR